MSWLTNTKSWSTSPKTRADQGGRAKADDDAKKKMDEITTKQNELNSFKQTVQRQFQERVQTIHNGIVSSINIAATNVAKRHGATLLLDKSGISANAEHPFSSTPTRLTILPMK